ncbi:hypothetical protein [Clostridium omnivorum]|uniref:YopX protein domain-containing protein n=1 Tax=Clostridium omnivorum TaxID=1604902 RepID=A0ABQ5ND94_9CLOT|nr:hypothetical protein [Clostridium sp. E14]GLC32905.1 hypothetical protein bsdE14_43150 [Clostridium sp. E14]
MNLYSVHLWDKDLGMERYITLPADNESVAEQEALDHDFLACAEAEEITIMNGCKLIGENKTYKYYVSEKGYLARVSKNTFTELGYIEDNMKLYKKLC